MAWRVWELVAAPLSSSSNKCLNRTDACWESCHLPHSVFVIIYPYLKSYSIAERSFPLQSQSFASMSPRYKLRFHSFFLFFADLKEWKSSQIFNFPLTTNLNCILSDFNWEFLHIWLILCVQYFNFKMWTSATTGPNQWTVVVFLLSSLIYFCSHWFWEHENHQKPGFSSTANLKCRKVKFKHF